MRNLGLIDLLTLSVNHPQQVQELFSSFFEKVRCLLQDEEVAWHLLTLPIQEGGLGFKP